jgi:hypothetical protein
MLTSLKSLVRLPSRRVVSKLDRRSTLRRLTNCNLSLARIGDGEMRYAFKRRSALFQRWENFLAEKLLAVLLNPPPNVLPCFNHHFAAHSEIEWIVAYERYPKEYAEYRTARTSQDIGILKREKERLEYDACWRKIARRTAALEYGDAAVFFLGSYVQNYERGEMDIVRDEFRALFRGRRILFVGPETPHGGASFRRQYDDMKRIGLKSADFISIPATDAATYATEIEAEILSRRSFDDVFLQAGPLATVLAAELSSKINGRALDVGSLNTQIRYLV